MAEYADFSDLLKEKASTAIEVNSVITPQNAGDEVYNKVITPESAEELINTIAQKNGKSVKEILCELLRGNLHLCGTYYNSGYGECFMILPYNHNDKNFFRDFLTRPRK